MCIHLPTTAVILWKNKCKKVVGMVVSREQNLLAEKQGLKETFFYSRLSVSFECYTRFKKLYRFPQNNFFKYKKQKTITL